MILSTVTGKTVIGKRPACQNKPLSLSGLRSVLQALTKPNQPQEQPQASTAGSACPPIKSFTMLSQIPEDREFSRSRLDLKSARVFPTLQEAIKLGGESSGQSPSKKRKQGKFPKTHKNSERNIFQSSDLQATEVLFAPKKSKDSPLLKSDLLSSQQREKRSVDKELKNVMPPLKIDDSMNLYATNSRPQFLRKSKKKFTKTTASIGSSSFVSLEQVMEEAEKRRRLICEQDLKADSKKEARNPESIYEGSMMTPRPAINKIDCASSAHFKSKVSEMKILKSSTRRMTAKGIQEPMSCRSSQADTVGLMSVLNKPKASSPNLSRPKIGICTQSAVKLSNRPPRPFGLKQLNRLFSKRADAHSKIPASVSSNEKKDVVVGKRMAKRIADTSAFDNIDRSSYSKLVESTIVKVSPYRLGNAQSEYEEGLLLSLIEES